MPLTFIRREAERSVRPEGEMIVDRWAMEAFNMDQDRSFDHDIKGFASSFYTLDGHMKAIFNYDLPLVPEPTHPSWNAAKQHVRSRLMGYRHTVHAISVDSIDQVSWKMSTAAGYGYSGLKGDGDNYRKARSIAYRIANEVIEGHHLEELANSTPDVAFTRTQLSEIVLKQKVRQVWGAAFHNILLEGLYAQPIIELFQSIGSFYYMGEDPIMGVPALIDVLFRDHDFVISLDWSDFDSTVQIWEIDHAFGILKDLLIFPTKEGGKVFDFIVDLFKFRLVLAPTGDIFQKDVGIPSGSYFTNIIGSIVNYTRISYLFHRLVGRMPDGYAQGDDSLVGADRGYVPRISDMSQISLEHGWKLQRYAEVAGSREETVFLKRGFKGGQMHRIELDLIKRVLYPEYPVTDPSVSTLRCYSIWKDGGATSQILFRMYNRLNTQYGIAEALPSQHELFRF